MAEILELLLSKARLEAEDAQRVLLGALNGLAALMLLESGPNQTAMAIQTYRQVFGIVMGWLGWSCAFQVWCKTYCYGHPHLQTGVYRMNGLVHDIC